MSDAVERLKWLCSPDAERLSDGERVNQFVKYGLETIDVVKRLQSHIQLHAGDCASLNNEVELMRSHWLEAENRVAALEEERDDAALEARACDR